MEEKKKMNGENITFEEFEKAVMQKILEKRNNVNEVLLEQYSKSQVIKRDFTGVGFFTEFKIPEDVPRVTDPIDPAFGDVIASINGSTFDFGFILFLKGGMIDFLEGYTWSDAWPESIKSYEVKHSEE